MSVSVTLDFPRVEGLQRGSTQRGLGLISGSITLDTYATNGLDISALTNEFKTCLQVICEAASGYSFAYDKTNKKLKAYWVDTTVDGAAQAEVVNSTDLSAIVVKFIALGY